MKGKHAKDTANKLKLAKRTLALCFAVVFLCSCMLPVFATGSSLTDVLREAVEETAASAADTTESSGGTMMDSFQSYYASYTAEYKTTYRFWLSEKDSYDLPDTATTAASDLEQYDDFYKVVTIKENTTLTAPDGFKNPTDPTGEGRKFEGWYYYSEYGSPEDFAFDGSSEILDKSSTIDVFAKWGEAPAEEPAEDGDKTAEDTKADDAVKDDAKADDTTTDDDTVSDDKETTLPSKAPAKSEAKETEISFDGVEAIYTMDDDSDIAITAIGQDSEKTVSVGGTVGLTSNNNSWNYYHTWSSSDDKTASVSWSGASATVKGLKAGTVTITHTWSWYDRNGNVQSKSETATITVTDEFNLYCYTLVPGKLITDSGNADTIWNGMGVSKISGLGAPGTHTISEILDNGYGNNATITYPTTYPDITVDGTTYRYASDDSENRYKEGYYTIKWIRVIVSNGANAGKNNYNSTVASGTNTYHLDGQITLNEKDMYSVSFELKDAGSTYFEVVNEEKYSKRVPGGTLASTLAIPTVEEPNVYPAEKTGSDGTVYKFDGWYLDEGCTTKVDFSIYTIQANTTFYGRYIPKDTVMPDSSYITVEKRFKGITKDQIPDGFFITIGGLSFPVNNSAYVEDPTTTDIIYRWKRNIEEGSYIINEYNTDVEGYDLTITINGTKVEDTNPNVEVKAKTFTVTAGNVITPNSNQMFDFGIIGETNHIFAVSVVGNNRRNIIVSKEPLSISQRESVVNALKSLSGNGSSFADNANAGDNEFYSLNDQNEIIIAEGKITYDSGSNKVTISKPSVWNKVVGMSYDVEEGNNPEVEIVNSYASNSADLTVTKTVTGNMADLEREFEFKMTIEEKEIDPEAITWTKNAETTTIGKLVDLVSSSGYEFTLKNGESIVFNGIPAGAVVTVAETGADDYKTTVAISNTPTEDVTTFAEDASSEKPKFGTVTIDATAKTIAFTNTLDIEPPTGVILDTLPYILMLAAVGGGAIAFFLRKRHHDDED